MICMSQCICTHYIEYAHIYMLIYACINQMLIFTHILDALIFVHMWDDDIHSYIRCLDAHAYLYIYIVVGLPSQYVLGGEQYQDTTYSFSYMIPPTFKLCHMHCCLAFFFSFSRAWPHGFVKRESGSEDFRSQNSQTSQPQTRSSAHFIDQTTSGGGGEEEAAQRATEHISASEMCTYIYMSWSTVYCSQET